jgi:hypothetical protein
MHGMNKTAASCGLPFSISEVCEIRVTLLPVQEKEALIA